MTADELQRLFPEGVVIEIAEPADEREELLYDNERALMSGMAPGRRREFAAGRNVARRALARLGVPSVGLPRRANDKDVDWPAEVIGSISHTGEFRAVACARRSDWRSVGLDVERAGPLDALVIDTICRPDELAALGNVPAPHPSDWPRLLFAMKEAAYKAWYPVTRRPLEFHEMRIELTPSGRSYRADVDGGPPGIRMSGSFAWNGTLVAAGAVLTED